MKVFQERNNITTAYILSFFSDLFFPITAWLFFYLRYLSFPQVVIVTAVGGIAGNILEIPTGAFADLIGRKKAIFISYLVFSFAMFGLAFTTTFWFFVLFAILNSLSNALYSGSLEALVYDTLNEDGKTETYHHVISKIQALIWVGLFIGAVFGGFMYQYWFRLPYIVQGIFAFLAALVTLRLKEPVIDTKKYHISLFLKQNFLGFKELFQNLEVGRMSFLFITLGAGYFVASSILGISQAKQYGLHAGAVGILFAAGYLISAAVSYLYPKIKEKLNSQVLLGLVIAILLGSFLLAQFVGVIIGCFLIIARIASSTTFQNTRSVELNKFISSKNRATSISTLVLLSQLPYAIFAYSIGDYIEKTSPNSFALLLGIILAIILIVQFVFRKIPIKSRS